MPRRFASLAVTTAPALLALHPHTASSVCLTTGAMTLFTVASHVTVILKDHVISYVIPTRADVHAAMPCMQESTVTSVFLVTMHFHSKCTTI